MKFKRSLGIIAILTMAFLVLVKSVQADLTIQLGDQDFSDGYLLSGGVAEFNAASAGEPYPFDEFYGSNFDQNFNANWSFTFTSSASIVSATLEFGIFDHDSAASGNQVAIFNVDGVDRTTDANSALEGGGGSQAEYNIYAFSVDPALLADGGLWVVLYLQGPGLAGDPGTVPPIATETSYNGAGLDFSRLTIVEEEVGVPEFELALPTITSLATAIYLVIRRRKLEQR